MNVDQLYEQLKKGNERQGYYFNRDMESTMFLLNSLLVNRERYGEEDFHFHFEVHLFSAREPRYQKLTASMANKTALCILSQKY